MPSAGRIGTAANAMGQKSADREVAMPGRHRTGACEEAVRQATGSEVEVGSASAMRV